MYRVSSVADQDDTAFVPGWERGVNIKGPALDVGGFSERIIRECFLNLLGGEDSCELERT